MHPFNVPVRHSTETDTFHFFGNHFETLKARELHSFIDLSDSFHRYLRQRKTFVIENEMAEVIK